VRTTDAAELVRMMRDAMRRRLAARRASLPRDSAPAGPWPAGQPIRALESMPLRLPLPLRLAAAGSGSRCPSGFPCDADCCRSARPGPRHDPAPRGSASVYSKLDDGAGWLRS
jgi:hypothetical protein